MAVRTQDQEFRTLETLFEIILFWVFQFFTRSSEERTIQALQTPLMLKLYFLTWCWIKLCLFLHLSGYFIILIPWCTQQFKIRYTIHKNIHFTTYCEMITFTILFAKIMSSHCRNKVETTNRCEALKYFNIFKMCPKSKYLLVVHLHVGLPNIWSIKFTLNIFTYLCFET